MALTYPERTDILEAEVAKLREEMKQVQWLLRFLRPSGEGPRQWWTDEDIPPFVQKENLDQG